MSKYIDGLNEISKNNVNINRECGEIIEIAQQILGKMLIKTTIQYNTGEYFIMVNYTNYNGDLVSLELRETGLTVINDAISPITFDSGGYAFTVSEEDGNLIYSGTEDFEYNPTTDSYIRVMVG